MVSTDVAEQCSVSRATFLLLEKRNRSLLGLFDAHARQYRCVVTKQPPGPTKPTTRSRRRVRVGGQGEAATVSKGGGRDLASVPAAGLSHFAPADGPGRSAEPVAIELSSAQVDQVVRAASDSGRMSVLLSGLTDVRDAFAEAMENPRLSGSLLCGLLLLSSFPADGSYVSIAALTRITGKSPSTVHRYVTTLLAVGLVERNPNTRHYRLADAG